MDHVLHFEKLFCEFFLNIKDIIRKQMKESEEINEVIYFSLMFFKYVTGENC